MKTPAIARLFARLSIVAAACAAATLPLKGADKKIVILAGRPSHPPGMHEFRAGSMLLQKAMIGLFELLLRHELCFPLALQRARHQAVLGLDRVILATGPRGFVGGALPSLLPDCEQVGPLLLQPLRDGERQLQGGRFQRRQHLPTHERIHGLGGHLLTVRRSVVAGVPRAHVGGAGSGTLVPDDHAGAAPATAHQAGEPALALATP